MVNINEIWDYNDSEIFSNVAELEKVEDTQTINIGEVEITYPVFIVDPSTLLFPLFIVGIILGALFTSCLFSLKK